MAEKDSAKAGVAVGAGALLGTAFALFFARKAQAAELSSTVSLDVAAMSALLAIAQESQNLEDISSNTNLANTLLNQIAQALGGPGAGAQNPSGGVAFELRPPAAAQVMQLPNYPIPYGMKMVIKARSANAGTVYVSFSEGDLLLPSSRYYLNQNETIEYELDTTSRVYLLVDNANDGIAVTVEQKGV